MWSLSSKITINRGHPLSFGEQVFKRPKLWRNSVSRNFEELEEHSKNLKNIRRA